MVASDAGYKVVTRPNSSLSLKGRVSVVALIAFVSLAVATGFALIGAWLVFPFAGLEVVAVGLAFYIVHCHSTDYESIAICDSCLEIEKRIYNKVDQVVFQRYWLKVVLKPVSNGDSRLCLRSHGKEVEFGRYMSNDQRLILAKHLRKRTGSV